MSGSIYAFIQNTKYALLSLVEFVEIYALFFGRTKQIQNLCVKDQIQFLGPGKYVPLFCFDYSFPRYIGRLEMCVFRNWNVAQAAIGHKIFLCPWLGCVQTFPSEQCISGLPIVPIFFL